MTPPHGLRDGDTGRRRETLRTARAGALGLSAMRWQAVLGDFYRLHDTAQMDCAAGAIMVDIDRGTRAALTRILDTRRPSL